MYTYTLPEMYIYIYLEQRVYSLHRIAYLTSFTQQHADFLLLNSQHQGFQLHVFLLSGLLHLSRHPIRGRLS